MLRKVSPGNILLLHDLPPHGEDSVAVLQNELTLLFSALQKNGCEVVPLELLIGKAVMDSQR